MGLCVSSFVLATETEYYIEMAPTVLSYSGNGSTDNLKPTGFKWTVGYTLGSINKIKISTEGSVILGVNSDNRDSLSTTSGGTFTNSKTSLEELYNINLKATLPILDQLYLNGYLGGSQAKLLSTADNYQSENEFDSSVSYGAGLKYEFLSDIYLQVNYMQYFKNLNATEFALGFKF